MPATRKLRILLALTALACAAVSALPQDDEEEPAAKVVVRVPQLASVLPLGAAAGSVTAVELRGDYLEGVATIVFTTADVSATVRESALTRVTAEFRVSTGAAPGPRYFRVLSPRGASNLLLFRVGAWPSAGETEPNNEPREASRVSPPVMVHGRLENQRDVDLFRFPAAAGRPLDLHVLAARSWSTADLSLAILDLDGRALATDEGTFVWDSYLHFTPPRDGDYLAAVMLTRMPAGGQSGGELTYQLAIGRAPLVRSAFPPYLQAGRAAKITLRGESLASVVEWASDFGSVAADSVADTSATLACSVEAGTVPGPHLLRLGHPAGFAAPAVLLVGEDPQVVEIEKNDTAQTAQSIALPAVVSGRIDGGLDQDWYRFEAVAKEALVFRIDAEKIGSWLDARLELLDVSGKVLAFNDDGKGRGTQKWDPELEFTIPEMGAYFIKVSSQQRRGSPDHVYALAAHKRRPDFALTAGAERLVIGRGDREEWSCTVRRDEGFDGDVAVEASGLPRGVRAKPLVIPRGKTSGRLELEADPDAPLGAARIEIAGRATIAGKEVCRTAVVPAARISASGPGFTPFVSTTAWLAVIEAPLFSFEPAVSEVFLVRGATAELGLKLARRRGFAGAIDFVLEGAPKGVRIAKVEPIDEGRMMRLTLAADDAAALGRSSVTIRGTGSGAARAETGPRVTIQVH